MSHKIACSHCNLEFEESVLIKDEDKYFCCTGCQGVYHLLKDEGLDGFYIKSAKTTLSPPVQNYEDSSSFNSSSFNSFFIVSKLSLIIRHPF